MPRPGTTPQITLSLALRRPLRAISSSRAARTRINSRVGIVVSLFMRLVEGQEDDECGVSSTLSPAIVAFITNKPLRHFHRQGETQESTPVLHDERDVSQIEPLEQPQQHVAVETKRVDRILDWLVGSSEAQKVRRDHAMASGQKHRDHLAIEIGPGRLTMQAEISLHVGRRFHRPLVHGVDAQALISFQTVEIMRSEGIARQLRKPLFRCAQRFDDRSHVRISLRPSSSLACSNETAYVRFGSKADMSRMVVS